VINERPFINEKQPFINNINEYHHIMTMTLLELFNGQYFLKIFSQIFDFKKVVWLPSSMGAKVSHLGQGQEASTSGVCNH
jgi:hypothetical protein